MWFNWTLSEYRKDSGSLAAEVLVTSRILHWDEKGSLNSQFNLMAKLVLVTTEDVILESCRKMMAFWIVLDKFHIPH